MSHRVHNGPQGQPVGCVAQRQDGVHVHQDSLLLTACACGIGGAASSSISNQGREEAYKNQGSLHVLAKGKFSSAFNALLMACFQSLSPNLLRAPSISA